MKLASNIAKDIKNTMTEDKPIMCEYVSTPQGIIPLDSPVISTEKSCDWCLGTEHYCPHIDPKTSPARIWLCANASCQVYTAPTDTNLYIESPKPKRELVWHEFCETNSIGDEYYDVRFENVKQSAGKVSYMLKFVTTPRGIILMRGDTGTGKTYAAMAMCELYTRKSKHCMFTTHRKMSNNWLLGQNDPMNKYLNSINTTSLLVIDDFGTGEPNPKFLEFFMELINTRLQWTTRGTVITTNLDSNSMNDFCGPALVNRLLTGQQFEFKGESRRKKTIL